MSTAAQQEVTTPVGQPKATLSGTSSEPQMPRAPRISIPTSSDGKRNTLAIRADMPYTLLTVGDLGTAGLMQLPRICSPPVCDLPGSARRG